jgi:hypothetical protein
LTDICSKSTISVSERKTRYVDFCRRHYVPLHWQPWWLDAVCGGGDWDVCISINGNGTVGGVWPFCRQRRFGLGIVRQPPLTAYGGPWLFYPERLTAQPLKRSEFEKKVLDDLCDQLPPAIFLQQSMHPGVQNWLPLYWAGFRQTTRYTYIFQDLSDLEKTRAGFKNTLRTDLKKALRAAENNRDDDAAALLFQLHLQSFGRQNRRPPYRFDVFKRLHEALRRRRQSAIFIARDRHTGAPHAGLYLAFDGRRASVLLTGADPAFKAHCAVWGLFWEALLFCSEKGLSLDFEGSMERNIERGFRAFGAQLTPYHRIWKVGNKWPFQSRTSSR